MVFLYIMGPMLEPAIGRVNFAAVYFASLLAGSFGALLFQPGVPTIGASGACFGILGALIVVAYYRGISIWQSGLGVTLLINIVFSLSFSGISIGGHLGGVVGGAAAGWMIVQLGERRRMPAAALAGCLLVAVISVAAAIAVAGSHGLTPNGLGLGAGGYGPRMGWSGPVRRRDAAPGSEAPTGVRASTVRARPVGTRSSSISSGCRIDASSSRPSTSRGPGREK